MHGLKTVEQTTRDTTIATAPQVVERKLNMTAPTDASRVRADAKKN